MSPARLHGVRAADEIRALLSLRTRRLTSRSRGQLLSTSSQAAIRSLHGAAIRAQVLQSSRDELLCYLRQAREQPTGRSSMIASKRRRAAEECRAIPRVAAAAAVCTHSGLHTSDEACADDMPLPEQAKQAVTPVRTRAWRGLGAQGAAAPSPGSAPRPRRSRRAAARTPSLRPAQATSADQPSCMDIDCEPGARAWVYLRYLASEGPRWLVYSASVGLCTK